MRKFIYILALPIIIFGMMNLNFLTEPVTDDIELSLMGVRANAQVTQIIKDCNGGICSNMVICFGPWYWQRCYNYCLYVNEDYVSCVNDAGAYNGSGCATATCGFWDI